MSRSRRPSPADLEAANGRTIPDVLAPDLRVLFVGINPGLWSGATGHHFARPGNRFWRVLHEAGFTPRRFDPSEDRDLPALGLGVTNLVARTTRTADELRPDELVAGSRRLADIAKEFRPQTIAVVGLGAYRVGFGHPKAVVGPQPERLGPSRLWVLPNPSGLNAHYQLPELVAAFRAVREGVEGIDNTSGGSAERATPPPPR